MSILHDLDFVKNPIELGVDLVPIKMRLILRPQESIGIWMEYPSRSERTPLPLTSQNGILAETITLVAPCCSSDQMDWCFGLIVIELSHRKVVNRPRPLVAMLMSPYLDVHSISIEQLLNIRLDLCTGTSFHDAVIVRIAAVNGSMRNGDDPWSLIPVLIRSLQILLQPFFLREHILRSRKYDLSGPRDDVHSPDIKRVPHIKSVVAVRSWHIEAVSVVGEVGWNLMIADACLVRHPGSDGLDHFEEMVAVRTTVGLQIIGKVSSMKDEIDRTIVNLLAHRREHRE